MRREGPGPKDYRSGGDYKKKLNHEEKLKRQRVDDASVEIEDRGRSEWGNRS